VFKHIIIPLDGSGLAETVLPMAVNLAVSLNSKVTLLHIIEKDASPFIHGDRHLTTVPEARSYLEDIAKHHFPMVKDVSFHVHRTATRDIAAGILAHQTELGPDLIIICTHGRGGLRQIIFGSIAQQVVESGWTPVLIIRPQTVAHSKSGHIRSLLAAADNDPEHGQGLLTALKFGQSIKARVHVIGVVPTMGTLAGKHATTGKFLPATTYQVLEIAEKELEIFLQQKIQPFSETGAEVSLQIGRGDPASIISKTAEAVAADIIILGTHGKAGTAALWSGSMAAKVIKQTLRPLLLVPVSKAAGGF
jgi:nucleotide-binding universal stress UspA family protein